MGKHERTWKRLKMFAKLSQSQAPTASQQQFKQTGSATGSSQLVSSSHLQQPHFSAPPARRSVCSINSTAGSRCSSRSSSSSGYASSSAPGLTSGAANKPLGARRADEFAGFESADLLAQLSGRAARAQSFSRVNLNAFQQQADRKQPAASILQQVGRLLAPARGEARAESIPKQEERAAANHRSQSICAPPSQSRRATNCSASSLTNSSGQPHTRRPCVSGADATRQTNAQRAQRQAAAANSAPASRLASYVNGFRRGLPGSNCESAAHFQRPKSAASLGASLDQRQHHLSLLHCTGTGAGDKSKGSCASRSNKRKKRASSSGAASGAGASLFSPITLFGQSAPAPQPPASSAVNLVRRELAKLLKSF